MVIFFVHTYSGCQKILGENMNNITLNSSDFKVGILLTKLNLTRYTDGNAMIIEIMI